MIRSLLTAAAATALLSGAALAQAPPTVVTSDPGGDFTGSPYPATATATGVGGATVGGTFAFTYYVGNTVNGNGSSTAPSAPGTYTVVAAFTSSDSNYIAPHKYGPAILSFVCMRRRLNMRIASCNEKSSERKGLAGWCQVV